MAYSAASPSPDRAEINKKPGDNITLLAGQMNAGSYRMLKLIAEFDDRDAWGDGGTVKSCAHWLNWKCGTASHVEQLVSKYKRVKRVMEDEAEQEREKSRTLTYYQDNDGMLVINARLSPEAGSLLIKAIEALVAPIQEEKREQLLEQRQREENEQKEDENVSAETFSEAIEKEDPNHFHELVQHTRADALVTLAEHFLATCGDTPVGTAKKTSTAIWMKSPGFPPKQPGVCPATPVW